MGNTQTPESADHDFYRRPEDGREQRPAQIVDVGSGFDAGAERGGAAGVGRSEGGASARTEASAVLDTGDQAPQSFPASPHSSFNYSLAAAWVLVGLLLAHGLVWLFGAFPVPDFDPTTGIATGEMPSEFVMNLSSMGSAPFILGLLGAAAGRTDPGSAGGQGGPAEGHGAHHDADLRMPAAHRRMQGGVGTVVGAVIGGQVMGVLIESLSMDAAWQQVNMGLVLLLAVTLGFALTVGDSTVGGVESDGRKLMGAVSIPKNRRQKRRS